jgi:hypothetical protein
MVKTISGLNGSGFGHGVDILSADWDRKLLFAKVHLGSEGAVRLPFARGARSSLLKHLVDLLKGKTLSLRNEEEGEEEGDAAETAPHEEDVGAKTSGVGTVSDEVGGDDTDDAIPEPAINWYCVFENEREGIRHTSWKQWTDRHHANGW